MPRKVPYPRTHVMSIKVSADRKRTYYALAREAGIPLSDWGRRKIEQSLLFPLSQRRRKIR